MKISDWFNKIYVSGNKKNRKVTPPQCSPEFWSIADAVALNLPCSQNTVEGWHNRIQILIDKAHVGAYKLIGEL